MLASLGIATDVNLTPDEGARLATWLSGRFTKTVRRASDSQLSKLLAWAQETGHSLSRIDDDRGTALAFAPLAYEDFPKCLRTLQVSGTDYPWSNQLFAPDVQGPTVLVLSSLTTGKAAAQASHGLWKWYLYLTSDAHDVDRWALAGNPINLFFVNSESLQAAQALGGRAVIDAGLTEIEPNTLTAVALPIGIKWEQPLT